MKEENYNEPSTVTSNNFYAPEVYEQVFELDTNGLDSEEIERLRNKAYEISSKRIQRILDDSLRLDGATAWMKYLYYRTKTVLTAQGQQTQEEFARKFTTLRGLRTENVDESQDLETTEQDIQ